VRAPAQPRGGSSARAETNSLWFRLATTLRSGDEDAKPLDGTVREEMQSRLGEDLGSVRVHTGPAAGESARSIRARAYALGENIAFAPGQFVPGTPRGDDLLEHELGHVVEQRHGAALGVYRAPDDDPLSLREPRQYKLDPNLGKLSLGLSTLDGFDFNSAALRPDHGAKIADVSEKLIMLLGKMPGGQITVTGHTDLVGGEDSNVALGLRRAEAVRDALGKGGVPDSAMSAASEGRHNPVVKTQGQEPRNRRVEVRFEGDMLVPGVTPPRLTIDRPQRFDFTLRPDFVLPGVPPFAQPQPPAPAKPEPKGTEGPAKPGSAGDVVDALTKVPEVKKLIDDAKEKGLSDLGKLSPGEKVAAGAVAVPLATGALAGIMSDPAARKTLLDMADGTEIPVPGVPWLKLKPITKGGAAGGMLQIDLVKIVPGLK
jgi:outer membrane protein OmpA-like peptidoglycan-associated protein